MKKDIAEFYCLMKLMPLRYWHRLLAFVFARALVRVGLPAPKSIVLPFRCVQAWASPHQACGLRFLKESAVDRIYSSFATELGVRTLFDIGANAGFVSLMLCRQHPQLHAVCFEPHPDTFRALQNNIALNNLAHRVRALNLAVGSVSGIIRFAKSKGDSMVVASPSPSTAASALTELAIPVISLDNYCEQNRIWPDAIKIDVEGHEEHVLRGSLNTLTKTRHVVLEWHSEPLRDACRSILESQGFCVEQEGPLFFSINRHLVSCPSDS